MNYIEKVINDRISELESKRINILEHAKKEMIDGGFDPELDFAELSLDMDDICSRKDELNKLKTGLGLIPVENIESIGENNESDI